MEIYMNLTVEERNKIKTKVQNEIAEIYKSHPFFIIEMGTGCHEIDHPILMYDGTIKKVQDVKIGDNLMGDDSTPRKVLREIQGFGKMYKIIPNKGEEFIVNEDHILSLKRTNIEERKKKKYSEYLNISIKDYLNLGKTEKHLYKLYKTQIDFKSEFYDKKSYYLGLWLGDGSKGSSTITNVDQEVIDYLKDLCLKEKCNYKFDGRHNIITGNGKVNNLNTYLRNVGVINKKHIPLNYLTSTRKNRLELLAGLLDSDGSYNGKGFEITQKNEELANNIKYLCLSLGFYCSINLVKKRCTNCENKELRDYFRLNIYGKLEEIPCKIKRKLTIKKTKQLTSNQVGFNIEELGYDDFYGFELDNNHLYLDGNFRVHHNSGKGLSVIKCIAKSNSKLPWLILVPEIAQIENFKQEFIKFEEEKLLNKVTIECYASLKNYERKSYNIVLNEVQYLSDNRFKTIQTMNFDSIIADSATIPEDIRLKLYQLTDSWYIYHLPLKEAVKLGMLPKPKIYKIPCSIPESKEKYEYSRFGKKEFYYADKYYKIINEDIKYWSDRCKTDKRKFVFNKLMSLASLRKRFISEIKTDKARELIEKINKENKRYIVFCGSTKQADKLGGNFVIHSKKSSKHNKELIHKFNNLEINSIFACGMLVSGMTLTQLDVVIVIQLDKGEENDSLKAIQQCGRGLRSQNPQIYLLYVLNSMDEQYIKNAVKAIGEEYLYKIDWNE